jgi:hypothetical protein
MNKSVRQKSQIIDDDSDFRYVWWEAGSKSWSSWAKRATGGP